MAENGIDISAQAPKNVAIFANERFDYVITLCDLARETCAALDAGETIHWSFADPTDASDRKRAFEQVVHGLRARIDLFVTVATRAAGPPQSPRITRPHRGGA